MPIHRIRLGPPWDVTAAGGRAAHRRRFGRPTHLGPGERVVLACDHLPGPATVTLNGRPLGAADGPFAADVTDLLAPRNELLLDAAAGPVGAVRLEIHAPPGAPA